MRRYAFRVSNTVKDALSQLMAAAESGRLATLCHARGIALMVLFGSALDSEADAHDLDLAVRFATDQPDVLGVLDDLSRLGAGD